MAVPIPMVNDSREKVINPRISHALQHTFLRDQRRRSRRRSKSLAQDGRPQRRIKCGTLPLEYFSPFVYHESDSRDAKTTIPE
jgi:hypothetical protein